MTQDEIKEALETCILGYCTGCPYDGCDGDCRDELHKDVLTLITEQEKEIERLKAENCELTKRLGTRFTCDFVRTAQKHAQIDVLNKVKEKLDSAPNGWAYTGYIDELIEEVENDKCNC